MSWYKIHRDTLTSIADSIRAKTGSTDPIAVADMPAQIESITGGGSCEDVRYVTFMSEDGTTELYKKALFVGDDCMDVVGKGLIETPVKESTNTEVFVYSGWALSAGGDADDSALKNVTEDRTVYAAFKASTRYYTVRFFDGETLLHTVYAEYGSTADYTPEKDGAAFGGWQPSNANITQDTDCYAQWAEAITFANATWAQIADISESGEAENYFAVGDTKEMTFNNTETLTMEIVGFNHDALADGTGKAGISVICTGTLSAITWATIITTSTSAVSAINKCSTYLYGKLPSDVKAVVKTVKKQCDTDTMNSVVADKEFQVWLPSTKELNVPATDISSSASSNISELGTVYKLYETAKCAANSKRGTWMLRTLYRGGDLFSFVTGGYHNASYRYLFKSASQYNGAAIKTLQFAFGFCV